MFRTYNTPKSFVKKNGLMLSCSHSDLSRPQSSAPFAIESAGFHSPQSENAQNFRNSGECSLSYSVTQGATGERNFAYFQSQEREFLSDWI